MQSFYWRQKFHISGHFLLFVRVEEIKFHYDSQDLDKIGFKLTSIIEAAIVFLSKFPLKPILKDLHD